MREGSGRIGNTEGEMHSYVKSVDKLKAVFSRTNKRNQVLEIPEKSRVGQFE